MSSGGQQPVTQQTTQSRDPWSGAQPALLQALNSGLTLYNQDVGYQPYPNQTQAGMHPWLEAGLVTASPIAWNEAHQGGSPGVTAARNQGLNLINSQGLTPGIQQTIGGLGGVANQFGSLYSDPTQSNLYQSIFNEASGAQNPFLQATIEANNRRIADKIGSQFSGAGRYGSAQYTDVMARSLAEMANPILAQDYARRQQEKLAATQGLGQVAQQRLGAAQGGGQIQQAIAGLYGQGLQRMGQWGELIPTLDEARYAPMEKLQQIGQFMTGRDQAAINDQIKLHNLNQARQWEQIARLNAIAGGAGGLGGTSIQTASANPYQASLGQRIAGGALAGAGAGSMFGLPGTGIGALGAGIGALGGGLLGLLG